MGKQNVPEDDYVLHRDKNNLPSSLNWVRASVCSHGKGHVKGGRIWVADPSGDQPIPKGVCVPEDYQGVRMGRFMNPMEDWIAFDQTQYHCVEPLSGPGQRSSIVLFSPSGLSRLSLSHWTELEHAGFPCHSLRSALCHSRVLNHSAVRVRGVALFCFHHQHGIRIVSFVIVSLDRT
eukprot:3480490-Amphidinium_carterae.3